MRPRSIHLGSAGEAGGHTFRPPLHPTMALDNVQFPPLALLWAPDLRWLRKLWLGGQNSQVKLAAATGEEASRAKPSVDSTAVLS